jgi:23S rRNA (cytidine1920-2'-O)/16S rRNA (cytidine1409-2'-O)-methyltransferase
MGGARGGRLERLDLILVARGLVASRAKAQALVMAGRVRSRGVILDKPGRLVDVEEPIELEPTPRHVGRGAGKLEGAISDLGIRASGRLCLDVGASTGGFTQVLLEHGASRVIALDVGRGQLDERLRTDARVVVLDGVNARGLRPEDLPFVPALATLDVSFISLEQVLPAVLGCVEPSGEAVALVKPQFEVGRGKVGRGGVVRDAGLHRAVLLRVARFVKAGGAAVIGICRSRVAGAEGNLEFFLHISVQPGGLDDGAIEDLAGTVVLREEENP